MTTTKAAPTTAEAATPAPTEGRARAPRPLSADRIAELTAQLAATQTGRLALEEDPDDLVFGRNIRTDAAESLDADFLASIAAEGFQASPTVWINPEGFLQVKTGHRRTLAARAVSYRPCPVTLVAPPHGEDAAARRLDEIGSQWDENEHRAAMSAADKLATVQEMLDLGATPTKVHKRLRTVSTADAAAVARISKAPAAEAAHAAAIAGELDLVQAATAAELNPTDKDMQRLKTGAAQGSFDRTVITIRRERRVRAALELARRQHTKKGFTVLDSRPGYYDTNKPTPLDELVTPGGRPATVADITNPSHWAVLLFADETPTLEATGEPIDADTIDLATFLDPDAVAAEGMHHANAVRYEQTISAHWYCTDRKGAGLKKAPTSGGTNQAKAQAAARSRKANPAARIETETRRAFVRDKLLTGRKTLPKGVIQWLVHQMLTEPYIVSKDGSRTLAAEWFGLGTGFGAARKLPSVIGYDDTADADAQKTTDARALIILAGTVIAAREYQMQPNEKQVHYWRVAERRDGAHHVGDASASARYLRVLVAAGYKPGPIERAVMGDISLTDALTELENA